jgi:tetratricopeptide (TPR) repeat protein
MGFIDDWRCEAPLEAMLRSKNIKVRVEAAKAMANRGQMQFLDEMIYLMFDDELEDLPKSDIERGGLFDAIHDMVKLLVPSHKDPLMHFCQGLDAVIRGKYAEAEAELTQAIQGDAQRWYYHFYRAWVTNGWLSRDHARCHYDCDRAIALRPYIEYLYTYKAQIYYAKEDYQSALPLIEKALTLEKGQCANTFYWQGIITYKLAGAANSASSENLTKAARAFSSAVESRKQPYPDAHHWLGWVYYDSSNYDLALKAFDTAIQLRDEQNTNDFSGRARAKYELGDYQGALEDFAIGGIHWGRGDIFQLAKDYEAALREYGKNVEKQPQDSNAYQARGVNYLLLERTAEALADLSQALDLNKDNKVNYYWRALVHINAGNWTAAIADLDLELSEGASQTDYIVLAYNKFWRAVIREKHNSTDEANTLYKDALAFASLIPDDKGSQSRVLGLLTLWVGQSEAARAHYERAIQQQPLRHLHFSPPLYLTLLTRLFPERSEFRETLDWYNERLGPLPTLPEQT